MNTPVINRVVQQLEVLPYELQLRVLEFSQALVVSSPRGTPGKQLLRFAGVIPLDDLQQIREAIEHDCEKVDSHEW
jgi:hypothetical protein